MSKESTHNFRLRFNLPDRLHLNSDDTEAIISPANESPIITLKVAERDQKTKEYKSLKDGRRLSIIGGPFNTEKEANDSAEKWRTAAETAFAYMGIGADFGDRAPQGNLTEEGLKWAQQIEGGRRVLNDVHGVMVYETEPSPLFGKIKVDFTVGIPLDETILTLQESRKQGWDNKLEEQLAYDLYSASFSQPAADARFLTLMMAVETLVNRKDRTGKALELINKLRTETKSYELGEYETNSILGALNDLKKQSIGDACKDLAKELKGTKYINLEPDVFIKKCYTLRSKLVHGQKPRPTREEVDSLAAALEIFVGHLLSVKLGKPFRDTGVTTKKA
ncbi:MAG: HEPN domain-containing protein [Candidatus Saccharibacteria bacterium]|nr:HEPN domain-containing protein [Candidatus Saccharibacteria bacterium]